MSPDGFNDYESMMSSTRVGINIDKAECVKAGHSPCDIPLCVAEGSTCEFKADALAGFCTCNSWGILVVFDTIVYTILFKLLYMPFWYLFVADCASLLGRPVDFCIKMSVIPLYLFVVLVGAAILWNYMDSADGFIWETLWWFITFFFLCCFEVVKGFTLGFLLGSYVIRPVFGPCASGIWKFLLA